MVYVVVDHIRGNLSNEIFRTEQDAIARADQLWSSMSIFGKLRRKSFYVASCDLDEDECIIAYTLDVIKKYGLIQKGK